jgi:hypothetical protein
MNTFFPGPTFTQLTPSLDFKETGKKFEGRYYQTRSDYTTSAKSAQMLEYEKVVIDEEGYLVIFGQKMVQIDELLFCSYNANHTILFIENAKGKITHLVYGYEPVFSMEKQTILKSLEFWLTLVPLFLVSLLGSMIYLIVVRKKSKEKNIKDFQKIENVSHWLSISLVTLYILDFVIFLSFLLASRNTDVFLYTTNYLTLIPILLLVASIIFLLIVGYLLISKKSSRKIKLIYILQLVMISLHLWFLFHWNWIGIPF